MEGMLQAFDTEQFGLTFDLGHHNLTYQDLPVEKRTASMQEVFRRFGPRIKVLHIHDNEGKGDDHAALGTGEIDFETVLGEARKTCPAALWSMELESLDALKQSVKYLNKMENVFRRENR
jgi:sugar phosphate isomerase/epimerase